MNALKTIGVVAVIGIILALLTTRTKADRVERRNDVVILYLETSTVTLRDARGIGNGYDGLYVYNSVSTDPSLVFTNQMIFRDSYGNTTYQSPQESADSAISRILARGYILTGAEAWNQVLRFERR